MKIYITGGTGLLGSELLRSAPAGYELFANYHVNRNVPDTSNVKFSHLDITQKRQVTKLMINIKPDIIIHTAAKSSPDFCEKHKSEAEKINIEGTRNILQVSNKIGSKVLIISSNHVFSGNNPPYSESSERDPVNYYGKTKVQNEDDVLQGDYNATVIRLMTLYGWGNPKGQKNTAMWVIDMLTQKKSIKVVDDIYNNFLWVDDAAKCIWKIVEDKIDVKLIQLAGAETASRYEFALKVAEIFKLDTSLISPVPKSYFQDEAPRPYNTIYDLSLMKEKLFKPLVLAEGIELMKKKQKKLIWNILT
jgi:dTDP-4-dehydrorhamnose reductase